MSKAEELETLRIAGIVRESIVDGPGIRFVIFAQGCPHHCEGCHNQATHDFLGGKDCSIDQLVSEIMKNPLLSGVTFSGGEPFSQPEGFYKLAGRLHERNPEMHLLAYSGYTYEELTELSKENVWIKRLLQELNALIDGRFILAERDLTLVFKGSANQRHIDLSATRVQGQLVLCAE